MNLPIWKLPAETYHSPFTTSGENIRVGDSLGLDQIWLANTNSCIYKLTKTLKHVAKILFIQTHVTVDSSSVSHDS
jgi:hypothetical protein